MDYVYSLLTSLGMDTIVKRFVFGAVLAAIAEYLAKPFWCFQADGKLRPWVLISPDDPEATYLPFGAIPLLTGFVFGFFV